MIFYLNGRLGGTTSIDNLVHPLIIDVRDKMKSEFSSVQLSSKIDSLDCYIAINGEIVSYYSKTGVYDIRISSQKKEIAFNICIDESEWSQDTKTNKSRFNNILQSLFIQSGLIIEEKLKKKKIDSSLDTYRNIILKVF